MFSGERFLLDPYDVPEESLPAAPSSSNSFSSSFNNLMGDILEREPASVPVPPKPPSSGFPQHKKRCRPSAFRRQREQHVSLASTAMTDRDDKKAIDEENRQRLASLSPVQIEQERAELMSSINPSLLQRFLRRARIDDDVDQDRQEECRIKDTKKSVSFDVPAQTSTTATVVEDLAPSAPPEDLRPASETPPSFRFHFPKPPRRRNPMPDLDPSSPSFLSDLQTHYFPDLPYDPTLISWLQPPRTDRDDPESTRSAYHPASDAEEIVSSAIRFSLLGTPLAPSTSLSLPTTLGLHHHGRDPHAAGYTIPELAILGRSAFPAQRCIAWQVIGRILFRLGKGQFGDRGSALVDGLWDIIEHEGVVGGMLAEADGNGNQSRQDGRGPATPGFGKHASASAWAVEGVWLWQTGGGGDRGLLKEGAVRSR